MHQHKHIHIYYIIIVSLTFNNQMPAAYQEMIFPTQSIRAAMNSVKKYANHTRSGILRDSTINRKRHEQFMHKHYHAVQCMRVLNDNNNNEQVKQFKQKYTI